MVAPQTVAPDTEWWMRLLEMLGAGILGAVSVFITNRARFQSLDRDVKDVARELKESVLRIEKAIADNHNGSVVKEQRSSNEWLKALDGIRHDNNQHHVENRERMRVQREQMFTVLRLVVKIARAIPAMNQADVDDANARFLALEVERID